MSRADKSKPPRRPFDPLMTADATTHGARSRLPRCSVRCHQRNKPWLQITGLNVTVALSFVGVAALAQTAVKVPKPEEKDKAERAVKKEQDKRAQRTSVIEFHGQQAFDEK